MRNSSLCVVLVFNSKHLVKTANINTKKLYSFYFLGGVIDDVCHSRKMAISFCCDQDGGYQ